MVSQNVRAKETFLVNKSGVDSSINTTSPNTHINNADGTANILDGQIGVATGARTSTYTSNEWINTASVTGIPNLTIHQGTKDSANPTSAQHNATYPLMARPFISSGDISARGNITVNKSVYAAPTSSIWVVGDTTVNPTGGIIALDQTEYALTVAYRGAIADKVYSSASTAYWIPNYTTPNYTNLSTAFPVDDLVQGLMWDVNRNSVITSGLRGNGNEPVVGMALDLTGANGTAVAALVPGFLPLVNTTAGVRGIMIDADLIASLQAGLPAGSSIVTIDITTSGTADTAQAFAIMALDRKLAFADEVVAIKWDIGSYQMGLVAI